ncbi:hypothetical protein VNTUMSATTG_41270 [Vibrio nigripulchritudo]|uniref:hypothetical protein n=1 Tax=Vibrio nigripulchritudo TaxID=28173 RepID=UPI00190970AF|nr:hypothetical protein [Vibrio nigripulchritudo]BCL72190.1 hypothetical protein VNTUMSATTG_41270 [Vibrio nigripulchritudo]
MKFAKYIQNYFPDFVSAPEVKLSKKLNIQVGNDLSNIVSWPPNVFLILYTLLEYTDKYRLIVSPQPHFEWYQSDKLDAEDLSKFWKKYLESLGQGKTLPVQAKQSLVSELNNVFSDRYLKLDVYDLLNDPVFTKSAFKLLVSVDELFSNINICDSKYDDVLKFILLYRTAIFNNERKLNLAKGVSERDDFSGLPNLADNDSQFGFVTFKTSVPQSGLTINNLCHNLTVIKPAVKPSVIANKLDSTSFDKKSYNILFLPWPLDVESDSFVKSQDKKIEMNGYFDFFDYSPVSEVNLSHFYSALISTIERVGKIDLIVLPECAINEKMFKRLKDILFEAFGDKSPSLLAGIYGRDVEKSCSKNAAKLAFIGEARKFDSVEQKKHHRWFLDRSQLRAYNLSGALDPSKKWWENISVDRRNLLILHTMNGVRLCPLICEDLARQEPVAQAVRATGPNLVVSLLLDGPQLKGRWPGKYSAVLSDDPGASVFSVTALGMTMRSTGLGDEPSRGVALWSEPNNGAETLELADNGIGLIVELEICEDELWSMDGRVKSKPVLRKKFHSSVPFEFEDKPRHFLKNQLHKLVRRGEK